MLTRKEYEEIRERIEKYVGGTWVVETMRTGADVCSEYILELLEENYTQKVETEKELVDRFSKMLNKPIKDTEYIFKNGIAYKADVILDFYLKENNLDKYGRPKKTEDTEETKQDAAQEIAERLDWLENAVKAITNVLLSQYTLTPFNDLNESVRKLKEVTAEEFQKAMNGETT